MKEIQTGMTNEEVIEILVDQRVNERFERMKMELREELAHSSQQNASSVSGEAFYRQQNYINTLCQVHGCGHRVDKELEEAIIRLKSLTES